MRLVQKKPGQLPEPFGTKARPITFIRRGQKVLAGVAVAQVDVAAEEFVVTYFGRRNQPDFPTLRPVRRPPAQRWARSTGHVAAVGQVDIGGLKPHLLVLL